MIFTLVMLIVFGASIYFFYKREAGVQKALSCSVNTDGSINAEGGEPGRARAWCNKTVGMSWGFFYVVTAAGAFVLSVVVGLYFYINRR